MASSEQAEGISQINVAVAEMDRVVQSAATVSDESADEMKARVVVEQDRSLAGTIAEQELDIIGFRLF